MTEAEKGLWAMVGACVIWGLSPVLYHALAEVGPVEVLAHRTIWSCAFFGLILALQGRLQVVWTLLRTPGRNRLWVLAAALLISLNWLIFIWAVQRGHGVEASLGYYIFPLVAVLLGATVLGERLSPGKWVSVGIAGFAVSLLTWGLGAAPWVALALTVTFAGYGLLKRFVEGGPVITVMAEVTLLAPVALGWLLWKMWAGTAGFGQELRVSGQLMLAGPATAVPLLLFSYALKRHAMSVLGLVNYVNPTLQFLLAVWLFGEAFTVWHGVAFAMIWGALALYSAEALRQERSARMRAKAAGTVGATEI